MLFRQKRIRTLSGKLGKFAAGSTIVVGARFLPDQLPKLTRIGFDPAVTIGDSVLPAVIGSATQFNAEGDEIIHRDRPMETAYRMAEWHWTEFRGRYDTEEMSKIVEIPYKRYPRTPVPPPSIELKIAMTADGQRILVSPPITYRGGDDSHLIHVINLMLEIMGYCQLYSRNLDEIIRAPLRRLNWNVLPRGQRTWTQLRPHIAEIIRKARDGNQPVIEHRLESINQYGPDFVAIGLAGFSGYVVFGFTNRNLFVFESVYFGNATYVFGDQWENLSKLTKMQVLDERLHKDRILHRRNWDIRIRSLLRPDPVKPR